MLDDHNLLCYARNELADALKVLLNPDIMTKADFRLSMDHANRSVKALNELIAKNS